MRLLRFPLVRAKFLPDEVKEGGKVFLQTITIREKGTKTLRS